MLFQKIKKPNILLFIGSMCFAQSVTSMEHNLLHNPPTLKGSEIISMHMKIMPFFNPDLIIKEIEEKLEKNEDINIPLLSTNKAPLFEAVKQKNTDLVQKLLIAKADPNIQDSSGDTPLMKLLLENKSTDQLIERGIALLLINYGTDLSLKNNMSKTVFNIAKKHKLVWFLKLVAQRVARTD